MNANFKRMSLMALILLASSNCLSMSPSFKKTVSGLQTANIAAMRPLSSWTGRLKDAFDFSRDKKSYGAFYDTFLKPGAISKIIDQKGVISYPVEYVSDLVSKQYSLGANWSQTTETPLLFAIKNFGNISIEPIYFKDEEQAANHNERLSLFRQSDPESIEQVQYNLTKSLISAGANTHHKFSLGGECFSFTSTKDSFIKKTSLGNFFPLKSALYAYNLGAVKALIEAGINVNEAVDKVYVEKNGQTPCAFNYFVLHRFLEDFKYREREGEKYYDNPTTEFARLKTAEFVRLKLVYPKILGLLKNAGAQEQSKPFISYDNFGTDGFYNSYQSQYKNRSYQQEYDSRQNHANDDSNGQTFSSCHQELFAKLGLPTTANSSEVAKAYKKQISKIHPDRFTPGTSEYDQATIDTAKLNSLFDKYKKVRIN